MFKILSLVDIDQESRIHPREEMETYIGLKEQSYICDRVWGNGYSKLQVTGNRIYSMPKPRTRTLDEDRGSKTQVAHGKEEGQSTKQQGGSRWPRRDRELGRWMHNARQNQGQFQMGWVHNKPSLVYCVTVQWRVGTKLICQIS